jgi:hypothetical protein
MAAHVAHDDTSSIGSNVSDGGSVEGSLLQKTFAGSNDEHEVTVRITVSAAHFSTAMIRSSFSFS